MLLLFLFLLLDCVSACVCVCGRGEVGGRGEGVSSVCVSFSSLPKLVQNKTKSFFNFMTYVSLE